MAEYGDDGLPVDWVGPTPEKVPHLIRANAEVEVSRLKRVLDDIHNDLREAYHHGGLSAESCKTMASYVKGQLGYRG